MLGLDQQRRRRALRDHARALAVADRGLLRLGSLGANEQRVSTALRALELDRKSVHDARREAHSPVAEARGGNGPLRPELERRTGAQYPAAELQMVRLEDAGAVELLLAVHPGRGGGIARVVSGRRRGVRRADAD